MNGVSLVGMDNARAIQVLREAMMKESRVHGFIGITVSRPRNSTTQSASPCREVRVSQAGNEDVVEGSVSTLPRPSPAQRLTAAGVSDSDSRTAANALSATLPADITQV